MPVPRPFVPLVCLLIAALGADQKGSDRKEAVLKQFAGEFVPLTPGKGVHPAAFRMGSAGEAPAEEKPDHAVTLRHPFAGPRYEVTQELYEAIMGKNPSRWKGPRNSVEMVS